MRDILFLIVVLLFNGVSLEANIIRRPSSNDQVIKLLDSAKNIAGKDKVLAQKLVSQAKNFSEKDDFTFGIGRAVFTNGYISHVNGKKDQAIVYYLESLEILKDLNSSDALKYKSFATRNIGIVFFDHYQFKNAFDYFDQSQRFAERLGSTEYQTIALYHKARSNRKLGLFEDAIDNLFDASELALDDKDYEYLINVNNQLGLIFKEIEKYDKAIEHYYQAFKYKSELENFNRFAGTAYHNIADTYLLKGDIVAAEENFLKAIDNKLLDGDMKKLFISYMDLAELYKNDGKYEKASTYYERALALDVKFDGAPTRFKIFKQMADLSLKMKNMDAYMKYTKEYTAYLENDIINNAELAETDQQYNIQMVTQRYYELVAAKQREENLKRWGIWASILVLLSIATYFAIARIRAFRLRKLMEKELREAMVDFNLDDL